MKTTSELIEALTKENKALEDRVEKLKKETSTMDDLKKQVQLKKGEGQRGYVRNYCFIMVLYVTVQFCLLILNLVNYDSQSKLMQKINMFGIHYQ